MSEQESSTRRDVLKKGAVAGGIVWLAPSVISVATAAAASCDTPFTLSENFNGLGAANPPGYTTYGPGVVPLVGGWTTTAGTTSVDAVVWNGPYGQQGFANTPPSPPVIIDLAGTPGPGGITRTVQVPCAGTYSIAWQRFANNGINGDTTLSITGTGVTPTSKSWGGGSGGVVSDSLAFTTTSHNATVTFTFATAQTGNGNTMITNISIS